MFLQELAPAGIAIAAIDHVGDENPVDAIWGDERPAPPREPVRIHDMAFAGEAVQAKLTKVNIHGGGRAKGKPTMEDITTDRSSRCVSR